MVSTRTIAQVLVVLVVSARAWGGQLELSGPTGLIERGKAVELGLRAGHKVRLVASAGTLGELQAAGPGRLRARYTSPPARYPQRVLIAAHDESGQIVEWITLSLAGEARLPITSDANVDVFARIAGVESAPVHTDDSGRAELVVAVPPGVEAVELVARSARGTLSVKRVPLELPPTGRAVAVCSHERVSVLAVDARGAPSPGPINVELKPPGIGRVGATSVRGPGLYDVSLENLAEAPVGSTLSIAARTRGEPIAATCEVPGDPPIGLTIALDRGTVVAGRQGPVRALITPRWRPRRLRQAAEVTVEPSIGKASPPRPLREGVFEVDWEVPPEFAGASTAELRAHAPGIAADKAKAVVSLAPGPPMRLVATPPRILPADGRSRGVIDASWLDAHGNFTSAMRTQFQAPRLREPRGRPDRGLVGQSVAMSEATTRLSTTVVVTLRRGPRRFEAGVAAGYLTNFARVSAGLVSLSLIARLPLWGDQLFVGVDTGFHGGEAQTASAGTGEPIALEVRAVPVRARVGWELRMPYVRPYLAFGAGALWSETAVSSRRLGRAVTDGWTWVVMGAVGAAVRAGPGRLGVELAYSHAPIDRDGVTGNIAGFQVALGYGVDFE